MKMTQPKYRSVWRGFFILLSLLLSSNVTHAQAKLDVSLNMMKQGKYRDAIQELNKLWEQRSRRDPEITYYLGFCLCREGEKDIGRAWLEYGKKQAGERQQTYFDDLIRQCGQDNALPTIPQNGGRANMQPGVISRSKGGWFFGGKDLPARSEEDRPTTGASLNLVSIPLETLMARLYKPEHRESGEAAIKKVISEAAAPNRKYVVQASGPFIFVREESAWRWKPEELKKLEDNLQRVMGFYEQRYQMRRPEYLITIYLMGDQYEMKQIAEKVHGMRLSTDVIGYSTVEDQSIAAIAPSAELWGTISHELFHLMVHSDFADIPNWLEEGMASAYAVATLKGNQLIASNSNWRAAVLRAFARSTPNLPLNELINLTWKDLAGGEKQEQQIRSAVNHALICYFVLYLQEKGKLNDVYLAYRDRKLPNELTDESLPLVRAMGKSLDDINSDFRQFLGKQIEAAQ